MTSSEPPSVEEPDPLGDVPIAPKKPLGPAAVFVALVLGAVIGGIAVEYWLTTHGVVTTAAQAPVQAEAPPDVAADVTRLKTLVPSQSHTMTDVGYHWAGLWFAAEKKNWPLAKFFFDEARQHIRWTIAIRPIRKGPEGEEVDIKGIWDAIDVSTFASVQLAIEDQNGAEFQAAYKAALESCYSCHKASGKPYLRPMIPSAVPQTIINYDPNAKWPE